MIIRLFFYKYPNIYVLQKPFSENYPGYTVDRNMFFDFVRFNLFKDKKNNNANKNEYTK